MLNIPLLLYYMLSADNEVLWQVYSTLDANGLKSREVGNCFANAEDKNDILNVQVLIFWVDYICCPEVDFFKNYGG